MEVVDSRREGEFLHKPNCRSQREALKYGPWIRGTGTKAYPTGYRVGGGEVGRNEGSLVEHEGMHESCYERQ